VESIIRLARLELEGTRGPEGVGIVGDVLGEKQEVGRWDGGGGLVPSDLNLYSSGFFSSFWSNLLHYHSSYSLIS
jgi:hypothetical protein